MQNLKTLESVNDIISLDLNNGLKITLILLLQNDSLSIPELNKLSCRTLTLENYMSQMKEFIEKGIITKGSKMSNRLNRVAFSLNTDELSNYIMDNCNDD